MGVNEPCGMANLDPRGFIGRIYVTLNIATYYSKDTIYRVPRGPKSAITIETERDISPDMYHACITACITLAWFVAVAVC